MPLGNCAASAHTLKQRFQYFYVSFDQSVWFEKLEFILKSISHRRKGD